MRPKSKQELIKFHRADFINKPGYFEDASIMSAIKVEYYKNGSVYWEGTLKIRDCTSNVSLDVHISKEEDYDNVLHKINTMIAHLSELRDAVAIHGKEFLEARALSKDTEDETY